MLYRTYKPFIRVNENEEKQIVVNEDLRIFFEMHPRKDGDIYDFFSIDDITKEDIQSINQLTDSEDEKRIFKDLKVGDYIIIEPHIYIWSDD